MLQRLIKNNFTYWILFLYAVVVLWWIKLHVIGGLRTDEVYFFNWFYGLIAVSGAIYGIKVSSQKWGGWKSVIGKGLILLSFGLLAQWFGLQVWTYYNVIAKIEVPYPSFADVGYFGLIPAYTFAAIMFAHAAGGKYFLRTNIGKIYALVIPFAALLLSYWLFLKDIGLDLSNPIKTFFDIGYPLGEIIPVSIAIFTLTLSTKILGGTMRSRILYLVLAFSFQFVTEYLFLYKAGLGTYYNGGLVDLFYATSYTLMSLGLITFKDYE